MLPRFPIIDLSQ